MIKYINPLLKYRIRWYQSLMYSNLIRFKHGIVLMLALLFSSLAGIVYLLSQPILAIIQTSRFSADTVIDLILIYSLFIMWALIQKKAI